jgi:hypothetical protein
MTSSSVVACVKANVMKDTGLLAAGIQHGNMGTASEYRVYAIMFDLRGN